MGKKFRLARKLLRLPVGIERLTQTATGRYCGTDCGFCNGKIDLMHSETIHLEPIGHVRHPIPDAEVGRRRRELISDIVILERFAPALEGIESWSHLFVLFWMHRVAPAGPDALRAHPRGRTELPLQGVLAARGRQRPNPVGLAVAELLERRQCVLTVRRLDAFDGTPVIDLKPYDDYDVVTDLRIPSWWRNLTP